MLDAGLILSRFLQYCALLALFGASLFPLYAYRRHRQPLQFARCRSTVLFTEAIEEFIEIGGGAADLVGAGAWLGGLFVLAYILSPSNSRLATGQDLEHVLLRFSGMGYVAIAGLVASGVINSWFLVGSVAGLV